MFNNISRIQNIDNDEMRDNNDIYRFLQNIFNIKNKRYNRKRGIK